ncbi:MAG: pyruvate ferredoxin oxidoreductase, partial [Gammaproteobacteria bacterium]
LIWLLNSGLPVKILVLSDLGFGLGEAKSNDPRAGLGLLALAQRKAFVAQTSIADAAHLGETMLQALASDGPALLQVYAPSPMRHGFETHLTLELARLAIDSRTLPLFSYDPHGEGVFGSRISLVGNPGPDSLLAPQGEEGQVRTSADWALAQSRFENQFTVLRADAPGPTPLHEWLQLDDVARDKKTPYISAPNGDEEQRLAVSRSLANVAAGCLANWQTLQELAGVVTPFTARVEADIRAAVAAEHQAELAAQKQAADAEIKALREQTQAEIAAQIRSRLLALASQKRN